MGDCSLSWNSLAKWDQLWNRCVRIQFWKKGSVSSICRCESNLSQPKCEHTGNETCHYYSTGRSLKWVTYNKVHDKTAEWAKHALPGCWLITADEDVILSKMQRVQPKSVLGSCFTTRSERARKNKSMPWRFTDVTCWHLPHPLDLLYMYIHTSRKLENM